MKKEIEKYYTIYLGNELWEDVIDDMNSEESWAVGGMLYKFKSQAEDKINDLKKYDFENRKKVFRIVELERGQELDKKRRSIKKLYDTKPKKPTK